MENRWVIYTDGSCTPTCANGYGAWVAIVISPSGERKIVSGTEYPTTSNRQEMKAVLEGIKATPNGSDVIVYSDSKYAVNTFSDWCWKWFKNPKKWATRKNTDLVANVMAEMLQRQVALEWVKGHNGTELNEECDRICNSLAYNLYDESRKRNHGTARKYDYLKDYSQNNP
jgi:ribonuclease HI